MTKKAIIIGIFSLSFILFGANFAFAQTCPSNTQVDETSATLVGEVTDDGGDPNLEVWFQYGFTGSYGYETTHQSKYGTGLFCNNIANLMPNTTYHYRAVARNSGGTSYGQDQTFTTKAPAIPTVDIKVNSSDGPITVNYQDYITISWNSSNANSCTASGDWSGTKNAVGSESMTMNSVKTYTFNLTCYSASSQSAVDSVQVTVRPKIPVVVTKPAVVTY